MTDTTLDRLQRFRQLRVTVVGDSILDCYYEGRSERVCREAPVPVVLVDGTKRAPGGAANTAANVAELGAQVRFASVVGDDSGSRRLAGALEAAGVDTLPLLADRARRTIVKRRLLCDGAMVARFDEGTTQPLSTTAQRHLAAEVTRAMATSDVVILSDYQLGAIQPSLVGAIAEARVRTHAGARREGSKTSRQGPLLAVDSSRLSFFSVLQPDVVKPSLAEAAEQLDVADQLHDATDRVTFARSLEGPLLELTGARMVALTLDGDGGWLFRRDHQPARLATKRDGDPHATGAGDTFLSTFALSLAAGMTAEEAGRLATMAATIVTSRPGTSACSLEDLRSGLSASRKHVESLQELAALGERYRKQRRRVVLTNGCFDILHPGHVRLLQQAADLGDVLVVAVNSDASIRSLKGDGRPINPLESRLSVIAGLSSVDHTFAFDSPTASEVVSALRPDIYAKGGDYSADDLPEYAALSDGGGRLELLPLFGEESTTRVIRRVVETAAGQTP